ncbi:DUF2971 domain-containing protein [Pseudomonas lurida]|uniref:DUF2971 domain-containing protein n=1 Tax=Pseudomonas lurida TaxID=244566 RepID=A0ABY9FWQ4_9PSED|nr:DUF2971 domain-containing protein [Pseudomonas lurida]WLH07762.1 DUF2971 domain-containing protein [Pseudomonas lurida]
MTGRIKPIVEELVMLYKYRSISARTEEIITGRKVWLAEPATLNDPLECQVKPITPEMIREHVRKVKNEQAVGFIMEADFARKCGSTFYGLNNKQIKHLLNRIRFAKGFNKKYQIMCDFHLYVGVPGFSSPEGYLNSICAQLTEVGVFSLSEDPVNTLMWSHYGESHRGIALGFDPVEGSDLADANKCREVIYSDDLSEFAFNDGYAASVTCFSDGGLESAVAFDDKQIQRAIFTKTTAWAYEREWRYVRRKAGSYDIPGPIAEVVFGAKCLPEIREKYRELVSCTFGHSVKFREAVFLPGTTTLELKDY